MSVVSRIALVAIVFVMFGCSGSGNAPIGGVKQIAVNTCSHDYVAYRDGNEEWIRLGNGEKNQEYVLNIKGDTYSVAMINDHSHLIDVTVANFNKSDEFRFDVCGVVPDSNKAVLPAGWKSLSLSAGGTAGVYDLLAKASNVADEEYYLLHQDLSLKELESQVSDFGDFASLHKEGESFNSGVVKLKERFPDLSHYSISYTTKNGARLSLHEDDKGNNRGIPAGLRHVGDSFSHDWYFFDRDKEEGYSYAVISMENTAVLSLNHRPKAPLPAKRSVKNGRTTVQLSPYYLDTLQKDAEFYSIQSEKLYGLEGNGRSIFWNVVASKGYLFSSNHPVGRVDIPEPRDFPSLKIDVRSVSAEADFGRDALSVSYGAYSPGREDWSTNKVGSVASSISVLTN